MVNGASDLLMAPMLRFLRACFTNAVAATTHCEDTFAHLRQLIYRSPAATHMAIGAAYHTFLESRRIRRLWFASLPAEKHKRHVETNQKPRAGPLRPIWTQNKSRRGVAARKSAVNVSVEARAPVIRAATPVDPLVPRHVRHDHVMK